MNLIKVQSSILKVFEGLEVPAHLNQEELARLTEAYQRWFDSKPARWKARHWAIYLLMRFTGCRVSEAIQVDVKRDIDFRRAEVVLKTLKRHGKNKGKAKRIVPLPGQVVAEIGRILAQYPELQENLFNLHRSTVFQVFKKRAEEAGIPEEFRHPHVLRHSRAIELLRAGVPVSAVQQVLRHASITTTAVYLRFSAVEVKQILKDRGLL